jgi:hypothetical protein
MHVQFGRPAGLVQSHGVVARAREQDHDCQPTATGFLTSTMRAHVA